MGYGLSVFQVPQQALARASGTNNQALLSAVLAALEDKLADYDEQMHAPDLENYDVDISHADALREIFAGKFTKGVNGSRYGWAFEVLCSFLGKRLDNTGFIPCKVAWYEQLDEVLMADHVPLRFTDLIYRAPISIPEADDWPCVGYWGPKELAAIGPLAALLIRVEDAEVMEALKTAVGWLREAAKQPGSIIVGFHG
jgi:hypothetical protein